jgi:hypothetical protein
MPCRYRCPGFPEALSYTLSNRTWRQCAPGLLSAGFPAAAQVAPTGPLACSMPSLTPSAAPNRAKARSDGLFWLSAGAERNILVSDSRWIFRLRSRHVPETVAREDSSSSELHNLGRKSRCVSNRLHLPNQRSFGVGSEKLGGRFREYWQCNQRSWAWSTVDIQRKWAASNQSSWAYL